MVPENLVNQLDGVKTGATGAVEWRIDGANNRAIQLFVSLTI